MNSDRDPGVSSQEILQHLLNLHKAQVKNQNYPQKPNRYSLFGWNRHAQDCYTENDIQLLNKIRDEYTQIAGKEKASKFFETIIEKAWYDFWHCTKPAPDTLQYHDKYDSFTLPNREAKDAVAYPLWSFADNMARQIANWQGERVKGQNSKLMNDPVMLVFYLLRNEFFNNIAMTECKSESIDYLAKLQSFIKNLVYWVPSYGPDRIHLHEIQSNLQNASKTLANCIANKELPQLLTDTITSAKSLESIIGTYLHFLVDQKVADNFNTDYFEANKCNMNDSPVCKLFQVAQDDFHSQHEDYKQFNKFYTSRKMAEVNASVQIQLQLRKNLVDAIKLPKSIDKNKYLEAMATLESLINVRKTIENFRAIQEQLGNYVFALKFLDDANTLAANYIKLIRKSQDLLTDLIKSADSGLKEILRTPQGKQQNHFEKNLRSLETSAAKDTKPDAQLQYYTRNAAANMDKYQAAMRNLVANIRSGQASHELEIAMSKLSQQIAQLNEVLPGLIENQDIIVSHDERLTLPVSNDELICEKTQPAQNKLFNYGAWDETIKQDPIKNQPIYTYRLFDEANKEVGSIEFYGQPMLCVSEDHKQHNIVKATGILSAVDIKEDANIDNICDVLPPSLFERVLYSAKTGALYGMFSGGSNAIAYTLKGIGVPDRIASAIRNLTYYGCIFSLSFHNYYQQGCQYEQTCEVLNGLYYAAMETGKLWAVNSVLGFLGAMLEKLGSNFDEKGWMSYISTGLKYAARLGFFGYQAANNGVVETATAAAAAIVVEESINYGSHKIHG